MSSSNSKCSVLVVGAGPTGLFLANELRRQGVDCRIIDQSSGPCDQARGTALQPRTLEIFEQVGVIDAFLAHGVRLVGLTTFEEGQAVTQGSFTDLESPFPFILSLPQSRTERLLIEELARHGQAVERGVGLQAFEQDAGGVRAVMNTPEGGQETISADYLVGCDGGHSVVRHQLGMHLEGEEYPGFFVVSDVRLDGCELADKDAMYLGPQNACYVGPLPEGRFLVSGNLPEGEPEPEPGTQPTLAQVQTLLEQVGGGHLRAYDPIWLAYFRTHKRLVPHYQVGRVFLAGDAAHIQSPIAGQGMNTGMQDSFNLAWKLALVLRGESPPGLLDSYHAERHYIGKQMLELSDQMHKDVNDRHPSLSHRVARWVADELVHFHLKHQPQRTTDEIRVSYHHSPIVRDDAPKHESHWQAAPQAGDRAPDGQLIAHPQRKPTRLFELFPAPRHHLLVFTGQQLADGFPTVDDLASMVAGRYGQRIELHPIVQGQAPASGGGPVWLDPDGSVHRRYGATRSCLYLIRPDGYIGYRRPDVDAAALQEYLHSVLIEQPSG